VKTPVAVHLLPSEKVVIFSGAGAHAWNNIAFRAEKVVIIAGRERAQNNFPLRGGEGGSQPARSSAGARRVRGHFLAFSAIVPIAPTIVRTNSSGCSSTIAFGMRNNRMPRVRK